MKFNELHPPILELAPGQCFHRVQLPRARKTSVRINGLLLAPTGLQTGRFCLHSEATAYFADSEHTALFESGIAQMKKVGSLPLVKPGTRQLLSCVTDAARRSGVPLIDFPDMG